MTSKARKSRARHDDEEAVEMRRDIFRAIAMAKRQPRVPEFSEYVFRLVQAGATVVPDDLWAELGEALAEHDVREIPKGTADFWLEENHLRTEPHEEWIDGTVETYLDGHDLSPSSKRRLWVVPTNELVCLHLKDGESDDFVSLTHLFFVGTEKQLRKAVQGLLSSLGNG